MGLEPRTGPAWLLWAAHSSQYAKGLGCADPRATNHYSFNGIFDCVEAWKACFFPERCNNNNTKPLTPKSMPPTRKPQNLGPQHQKQKGKEN